MSRKRKEPHVADEREVQDRKSPFSFTNVSKLDANILNGKLDEMSIDSLLALPVEQKRVWRELFLHVHHTDPVYAYVPFMLETNVELSAVMEQCIKRNHSKLMTRCLNYVKEKQIRLPSIQHLPEWLSEALCKSAQMFEELLAYSLANDVSPTHVLKACMKKITSAETYTYVIHVYQRLQVQFSSKEHAQVLISAFSDSTTCFSIRVFAQIVLQYVSSGSFTFSDIRELLTNVVRLPTFDHKRRSLFEYLVQEVFLFPVHAHEMATWVASLLYHRQYSDVVWLLHRPEMFARGFFTGMLIPFPFSGLTNKEKHQLIWHVYIYSGGGEIESNTLLRQYVWLKSMAILYTKNLISSDEAVFPMITLETEEIINRLGKRQVLQRKKQVSFFSNLVKWTELPKAVIQNTLFSYLM